MDSIFAHFATVEVPDFMEEFGKLPSAVDAIALSATEATDDSS